MFRIKRVDLYISKKYIFNLILGSAASLVIFFVFDLFAIIERVTAGKVSFADVPYLVINAIPAIISYEMMHLASLIAAILTVYDMNTHLELIVLKTSGISFKRIIIAPMVIAFTVSMSLFAFTEFVSINTFNNKVEAFRKADGYIISKNRNNIFYRSDNQFFRISNVDGYNNRVINLQVVTIKDDNIVEIMNAERGYYDVETGWTLETVVINKVEKGEVVEYARYVPNFEESIEDFLKYRIISDNLTQEQEDFGKTLTFKEVRDNISFLQAAGGNYKRLLSHIYNQRIAYPFSVVIMTLIGFCILSGFSRSGKGNSILMGMLIGFAYYVSIEIARAIGISGALPIFIAAWIPNIIFLLIGLYYLFNSDN